MSEFDIDDLLEKVENYVPGALDVIEQPAISAYDAEKMIGKRRENGALKLKRLKTKHREVIALHILGKSLKEISLETGFSFAWISTIINDPLSQELITEIYLSAESELKSLMPQVLDVIRASLNNVDIKVRLSGVDRYAKLIRNKESIVIEDNSTNTIVIAGARDRFIKELQEVASKAIDITDKVIEIKKEDIIQND